MAPTNLSALNIKGTTIHKFVTKIKKMDTIYNLNYDYIFIDEISMVKEIFYKFFIMVKRIKPNIKFIIAGDFQQLPPINDRISEDEFDYESSLALKELCDFNKLELTKCRRSDDKLFNMCKFENINNIDIKDFNNEICERNLAYTNKKRIKINKDCMDKYKSNYHGTKQYLVANKNDDNSQDVILYPKLPIICKKNELEMELINNEQFIISKLTPETVHIENKEKKIMINIDKFQEYFYPAYCITIHKSQGQTYDFPYTIHEWNRLDKKLKYVALTRATDIKLINIII
jgi:ATP-dependent exoDNAse (exonuclease V) alpha subunit